jgi:hypothetical protein
MCTQKTTAAGQQSRRYRKKSKNYLESLIFIGKVCAETCEMRHCVNGSLLVVGGCGADEEVPSLKTKKVLVLGVVAC